MIDCLLRRAEYSKFYNDMDNAIQDFNKVIELCSEFIQEKGNDKIQISALFSLGKIYLDLGKRTEALKNFQQVHLAQSEFLLKILKEKGQNFDNMDENQIKTKLAEPSVFDDE